MSKYDQMKQVRDDLVAGTTLPLYEYRTANTFLPVSGEGSLDAHIMFIGEAPGLNEAKQGRPFCGASGKFLDELIASIGLQRADAYITSIVHDRPPENRDPTDDEIAAYSPFLDRMIEIIQPKVIATLGRFSMTYIMHKCGLDAELGPISTLHGKEFSATASYGPISIVTLYHPAGALYNGSMRNTHKKDFEILKKYI